MEKSSTVICNEHYIPYDDLKKYYIKVDNAPSPANIRWYNQKFEYIGYGTVQSSGMINKFVYTDFTLSIPSDKTPKYFKIRRADATLLNSTWCVSTDLNYFGEYVESLITANLPENEFIGKLNDTYKDTLTFGYVTDDSKCHLKLKKKIGKKVFKADDNWIRSNSNASVRFSIGTAEYATDGNYETDIPKFKSNYFQPNTFANIYLKNQPGISWWFNSEKKNWVFSFGNNMSLEEFKTFLSEHTVETYYPLETPYELDLCPIDMPLSYKKITNIFTDNDLLPTINAKYYRTFQTTVQNLQINEKSLKQEITDLNNNISDITKRLEALESSNVNTVEESEASNDLQN